MHPVFLFRTALLLLFSVALTACAALQEDIEPPGVRLVGVTVKEAGILTQRYGVTLRIENPNRVALPIRGVTYALELAGTEFATGQTPNRFSVPAYGESDVEFNVSTNLLATIGHLAKWLQGDPQELDYRVSGKVDIDLPLVGAIPFETTGAVALAPPR